MTAWFDKSDVYFSVDVDGGEPTTKLHTMVRYKQISGTRKMNGREKQRNPKEGLYNKQEQILNSDKQ